MPANLIFGPSAHQIGPSPSKTAVGVQVKGVPVATTLAIISSMLPLRRLSRSRHHDRLLQAYCRREAYVSAA
jgi:hypothetical protein